MLQQNAQSALLGIVSYVLNPYLYCYGFLIFLFAGKQELSQISAFLMLPVGAIHYALASLFHIHLPDVPLNPIRFVRQLPTFTMTHITTIRGKHYETRSR